MTPLPWRGRGAIRPGDALPPRRAARRQCACPVEHGTHIPGQCRHTVTDGPLTTGCPCGTASDHHTPLKGG